MMMLTLLFHPISRNQHDAAVDQTIVYFLRNVVRSSSLDQNPFVLESIRAYENSVCVRNKREAAAVMKLLDSTMILHRKTSFTELLHLCIQYNLKLAVVGVRRIQKYNYSCFHRNTLPPGLIL